MELNKKTRLLVVAAHPDDETLGCGGTIIKAIKKGAVVSVLFLGEGVSARFPIGEYDSPKFIESTKIRTDSCLRAMRFYGITDFTIGKRYCTQFDTVPMLDLVKEIEKKIDQFMPTILLTHNPSEVNIDHSLTYEAVEIACRPTRKNIPNEIYGFEIVCSGSWKFDSSFCPNVYVDIEKEWDKKFEAWRCYQDEDRDFPFPRSYEGLKTLAQYRGMASNLNKAEGFRLLRKITL